MPIEGGRPAVPLPTRPSVAPAPAAPAAAATDPICALSVDVEDYYQVAAFEDVVSRDDWPGFTPRVDRNTRRLLDLLGASSARATFFTLGCVAESSPGLIREIHARGHELAVHSWDHRSVKDQTPELFRADARRAKAVIEDLLGEEVIGFRAPTYSIVRETLWAADILLEEGYRYDSSVFPIRHDRYGIPDAPRFPWCLRRRNGASLVEFPISTVRVLGTNFPFVGGGYLRLLPWAYIRWGMRRVTRTEGQPVVVYVHPWEIDPAQPRLPCGALTRLRHYRNLDKTEDRLTALCNEFRFASLRQILGL